MNSIRLKLIRNTALAVATALIVTGLLIYIVLTEDQIDRFDKQLFKDALMITSFVEQGPEGIDIDFEDLSIESNYVNSESVLFTVLTDTGEILYSSSPIISSSKFIDEKGFVHGSSAWIRLDGVDERMRYFTLHFKPRVESKKTTEFKNNLTAIVFRSAHELDLTLNKIAMLFSIGGILTIILVVLVLTVSIRITLSPLDELRGKLDSLGVPILFSRIQLSSTPSELTPVITTINNLFDRLKKAFEHEKQFNNDVAHELRTPVSGLLTRLEVLLSKKRTIEEFEAVMNECLQISTHMQRVIDALLLLARLEDEAAIFRGELINIETLVLELWQQYQSLADKKRVNVTMNLKSGVDIRSNTKIFSILVQTLLENAASHVDNSGWIEISMKQNNRNIELVIKNTGCQIQPDQIDRIFNRFWRHSFSRSDWESHSGLGLSIARKASNSLGMKLAADLLHNSVFQIKLGIPST